MDAYKGLLALMRAQVSRRQCVSWDRRGDVADKNPSQRSDNFTWDLGFA